MNLDTRIGSKKTLLHYFCFLAGMTVVGSSEGQGLDAYREEIDYAKAIVIGAPTKPNFDAARTAQLLIPDDESLCAQLQQKIKDRMAHIDLFKNL